MIKKILALVIVILVVAVGVTAYSFFKTPEGASGSIEAVPIAMEVEESIAAETSGVVTAEATATPVEEVTPTTESVPQAETKTETVTVPEPEPQVEPEVETETQAEASTDTDASIDAEESTDTETATNADAQATGAPETQEAVSAEDAPGEGPIIFEIVPAESQARFLIDEVLRGSPITVVGATDQVAGQLALNPADLSSAQIGIIQVNARTLATDNDFRNRAIKNRILLTDNHEFVTFTPTGVVGLPETGAEGETYSFQIVGDLTVTDVTRPVTFDVVATAASETRIEGTASTAFLYTDFGLFIPDAPAVDTVDDEVRLELEFVAEALS